MLNSLKSYRWTIKGVFFLCLCIVQKFSAQNDSLFKAQSLCNDKKFDIAIPIIDKVVLHPETHDDPASWHIRAFSYLQSFKQLGSNNSAKLNLLDTALVSAIKAKKLDTKDEYKANNDAFIKNGAITYYKLCTILLQDSFNPNKSDVFYQNYKKYTTIINPAFDFKQKDIDYYNTKGGIFADLYMKNDFNQKYGDIAKSALLKVLELDNKNISANINLGILYYNQGASLMRKMEYDIDLSQLDVVQENAKKLFKQSLPFMIKVYELDPKAERAIESLEGIYTALLDEQKATEFKQKKEALNKKQ